MRESEESIESGHSTEESAWGDAAPQRFLQPERIEQIGELVAPMIEKDLSWIERRKESVTILDETALRRQISVDFSLRGTVEPLLPEEGGSGLGDLFCAPLFILPKSPSSLMAFDLEDEEGRSLWLISREDNARISAAALVTMARRILLPDHALPEPIEVQLRELAVSSASTGKQIAIRLLSGPEGAWSEELSELRRNERFSWWLQTLGHSSILVTLFRSPAPRRKLVKLTFQERIQSEQRVLARLGWAAYRVAIDISLFEARSSHFEAEAPRGLRISEARLTDNHHPDAVRQHGFLRRVHLYRPHAESANAATAILWLVVSGGFMGGAALAALLTVGALVTCAFAAESIAANPTSAPTLLLALPGLIASYVARPDQHALTTRLLSFARGMLMISALCAYTAAAKVALSGGVPADDRALEARTDSLRSWLIALAAIAGILLVGLAITYLRGKVSFKRNPKTRFRVSGCFALTPSGLISLVRQPGAIPGSYELEPGQSLNEGRFISTRWHGTWFLSFQIKDLGGESVIAITGDYVPRFKGSPFAGWFRRRETKRIDAALGALQEVQ